MKNVRHLAGFCMQCFTVASSLADVRHTGWPKKLAHCFVRLNFIKY